MNQLVIPVKKENETITEFINKCEEYELKLNEEKYIFILTFLNEWLIAYGAKLKSLTEFKKISLIKVLSSDLHNKKILRQNSLNLYKLFRINLRLLDDDVQYSGSVKKENPDTNALKNNIMVEVLKDMLSKISYHLYYEIKSKDVLLSIQINKS